MSCNCENCTCREAEWTASEAGLLEQLWNSGTQFAKLLSAFPGRSLHEIMQQCEKMGLPSSRPWSSKLETK